VGTLMGAMLPFALRKLGADPASASAPLVATLVDVSGIIIYFTIASIVLSGTVIGRSPGVPPHAASVVEAAFHEKVVMLPGTETTPRPAATSWAIRHDSRPHGADGQVRVRGPARRHTRRHEASGRRRVRLYRRRPGLRPGPGTKVSVSASVTTSGRDPASLEAASKLVMQKIIGSL